MACNGIVAIYSKHSTKYTKCISRHVKIICGGYASTNHTTPLCNTQILINI